MAERPERPNNSWSLDDLVNYWKGIDRIPAAPAATTTPSSSSTAAEPGPPSHDTSLAASSAPASDAPVSSADFWGRTDALLMTNSAAHPPAATALADEENIPLAAQPEPDPRTVFDVVDAEYAASQSDPDGTIRATLSPTATIVETVQVHSPALSFESTGSSWSSSSGVFLSLATSATGATCATEATGDAMRALGAFFGAEPEPPELTTDAAQAPGILHVSSSEDEQVPVRPLPSRSPRAPARSRSRTPTRR